VEHVPKNNADIGINTASAANIFSAFRVIFPTRFNSAAEKSADHLIQFSRGQVWVWQNDNVRFASMNLNLFCLQEVTNSPVARPGAFNLS
jgi:hypothetical protein